MTTTVTVITYQHANVKQPPEHHQNRYFQCLYISLKQFFEQEELMHAGNKYF